MDHSMLEHPPRIQWIDCAKAVAIVAVLIDHNSGLLYKNPAIERASYFSVSLFILLSGIAAWKPADPQTSVEKGKYAFFTPFSKFRGILTDYALAVLLLQIWYTRFFDLKTYLTDLANFSIQSHYYFLVFFLQLKLISPALVSWCRFCNTRKGKWGWQLATLAFLGWFSSILIRCTFVLPVYGGGQFLFGGTYLLLYYLGIFLSSANIFDRTKKQCAVLFVTSGAAWCGCLWMICRDIRPLDVYLIPYWGGGINPPSVQLMMFALATLFFTYAGVTLLEELTAGKYIVNGIAVIGRYTLYIFMYHRFIRDIICTCFPTISQNKWVFRFGIFSPHAAAPGFCAARPEKCLQPAAEDVFNVQRISFRRGLNTICLISAWLHTILQNGSRPASKRFPSRSTI